MTNCAITTCPHHKDGIEGGSIYLEYPVQDSAGNIIEMANAEFCDWLCLLKFVNNQAALEYA